MRPPNYNQARKKKEESRKARQLEKQQRRVRPKPGTDDKETEPREPGTS